ncbi:MAG: hypothetical protein RR219_00700 [Clostridiales bacterium]
MALNYSFFFLIALILIILGIINLVGKVLPFQNPGGTTADKATMKKWARPYGATLILMGLGLFVFDFMQGSRTIAALGGLCLILALIANLCINKKYLGFYFTLGAKEKDETKTK